jgi:hypothetical protein
MAGTPHNLSPRHSEISTIDDMPSNSSSGSQTTRLTPELGSDDSDLDLDNNELEDGIALQTRRHPTDSQDVEDMGLLGGAERHNRRRGSASTVMSFQLYTPDEERAVVRKFDRKLVLFVALLYMLSFLDRSSSYFPILIRYIRTVLTEIIYRYWKRTYCWTRRRSQSQLPAILMDPNRLLYRIYRL